MEKPTAIVIGAGIGGLATACLLAKTGWEVSIYEKNSGPGGRAGQLKIDGFTFDTGPSWYLMPDVYEQFFALLGVDVSAALDLQRLDPAYKVFYENHVPITVTSEPSEMQTVFTDVDNTNTKAARELTAYLASARQVYNLAVKYFLYNPFSGAKSYLHVDILSHVPKLFTLLTTPLHKYVAKRFTNQALQQILEYPAVFLGSSPFKVPALYHLMSHLDMEQGVYYPKKGIYSLVQLLEQTCRDLGVQITYNADVKNVLVDNKKAVGIILADGSQHLANIVVSNADLHHTETVLVPRQYQTYPEKYWLRKTAGPSALLLYLGVKGSLPQLPHHSLFFVKQWAENFADIYDAKLWPTNPSMYVSKTSATDETVAPEGFENVFVLVPLPSGIFTTETSVQAYADRCIDTIAKRAGITDLQERIVSKTLYTPQDFEHQLNSWNGGALGLGHTLLQSAFFRPRGKSRKLNNLYYVGGDTQPGIGMPMCLISAQLVYKRLTNDHSAGALHELKIPKNGWKI